MSKALRRMVLGLAALATAGGLLAGTPATAEAASYCKAHDRYVSYSDLSGATVHWHHLLYYCIDANDNVKRVSRDTTMQVVTGVGVVKRVEYKTNLEIGNGTPYYSSAFSEHLTVTVGGQTFHRYPYSKFVVNGHTHHVDYYVQA